MTPELPLAAQIGIAVLLLAQGTWLFLDARKKRRFPWFWGIWGLTGFPTPLVVYLIVSWIAARKRSKILHKK